MASSETSIYERHVNLVGDHFESIANFARSYPSGAVVVMSVEADEFSLSTLSPIEEILEALVALGATEAKAATIAHSVSLVDPNTEAAIIVVENMADGRLELSSVNLILS